MRVKVRKKIMFENCGLQFEGIYQFDFINVKINYLVRSMFTMQMEDMFREQLWRKWGRPRELYPDESTKDAPVPPDLPVPNCDCGRPADVFPSRHPDTTARCFYTCSRFNVSNYFRIFFSSFVLLGY